MFFFTPQKKSLGNFPYTLDVFSPPEQSIWAILILPSYLSPPLEKEHLVVFIGSLQLVWLPQLNCVTICFS